MNDIRETENKGCPAKEAAQGSHPEQHSASPNHACSVLAISLSLAGMLSAPIQASANADAVPVAVEGQEIRVSKGFNTKTVTESPELSVEVGTTEQGEPLVVKRLYYREGQGNSSRGENANHGGDQASGASVGGATPSHGSSAAQANSAALVGEQASHAGPSRKPGDKDRNAADEGQLKPFLVQAVTSRSASFSWEGSASTVYAISRDGQPLAQVTGNKYTDATVAPGSSYQYTIEVVSGAEGEEQQRAATSSISVTTLDAAAAEHGSKEKSLEQIGHRLKAQAAGGPLRSIYKRRTFIPYAEAQTAWWENAGCGVVGTQTVVYKGDDRSWDLIGVFPPNKSRTEVTLIAEWKSEPSPRQFNASIHVSPTVRHVDGKEEVKQAEANPGWLAYNGMNAAGTYGRAKIEHDIPNPFCDHEIPLHEDPRLPGQPVRVTAGSIYYNEWIHMWNDGSIRVYGERRRAPRHEGILQLITHPDGKPTYMVPMVQRELEGFRCLVPQINDLKCGGMDKYEKRWSP